jgi:hypothetical protein
MQTSVFLVGPASGDGCNHDKRCATMFLSLSIPVIAKVPDNRARFQVHRILRLPQVAGHRRYTAGWIDAPGKRQVRLWSSTGQAVEGTGVVHNEDDFKTQLTQ